MCWMRAVGQQSWLSDGFLGGGSLSLTFGASLREATQAGIEGSVDECDVDGMTAHTSDHAAPVVSESRDVLTMEDHDSQDCFSAACERVRSDGFPSFEQRFTFPRMLYHACVVTYWLALPVLFAWTDLCDL